MKSRDAYIRLHDWLSDRVNDPEQLKDVSISIGPKGSYFARCGSSYTSHALPKDLQSAIEKDGSMPRSIALGMNGSWIVLWGDGTRSWDLRHVYPSLASGKYLSRSSNQVVFAALNPYREDNYFVVTEDGACSYSAAASDCERKSLHELTDTYMRMRAKRDGSSFSYSTTGNGIAKQVEITPNSNEQETRGEALTAMLRARQGTVRRVDLLMVGTAAGTTGLAARAFGVPAMRAIGLAASTSVGAAASLWVYRN